MRGSETFLWSFAEKPVHVETRSCIIHLVWGLVSGRVGTFLKVA
ncbi:MAG: hypothetical protein OXI44_08285 [Bacteroidota bacterium]|nr:hypothetical protein [Bacteroidota bacterium]